MQLEDIKRLLDQAFPEATHVDVGMEGSHINVVVVSDIFKGMSAVKKQQSVYGVLSELIASGAIHAVNMKTLTPDQWS